MTTAINSVSDELIEYVLRAAPHAQVYEHAASRTSEESMEARFAVSGKRVTGAKALLIKMDVKDQPDAFAVIVLPGFNKLDSKALKQELKTHVSGMRSFRFATPDEMARLARGVEPGRMPPIGRPIFPDVDYTFIDLSLLEHEEVGFNAAHFEKSIIVPTQELLAAVPHDAVFACSTNPE